MLLLSPKFKDFILTETSRDYLEGTTAAGKTTVGIFKFMLMVAKSDIKYHVIAGADIGTVEKNVINSERGLLEQFEGITEYYGNGKGNIKFLISSIRHLQELRLFTSVDMIIKNAGRRFSVVSLDVFILMK